MAKIQDREATIKTAMVEIKALTVSGKQVTLALFRQLQEEDLIDEKTLQFRGIPWGRVNYHFDGCGQRGEHVHVVWQHGDELRRSEVAKARGVDLQRRRELQSRQCAFCAFMNRVRDLPSPPPVMPYDAMKYDLFYQSKKVIEEANASIDRLAKEMEVELVSSVRAHLFWRDNGERSFDQAVRLAFVSGLQLWSNWAEFSAEQWLDESERRWEKGEAEKARWESLYRSLLDLDQLFIAL